MGSHYVAQVCLEVTILLAVSNSRLKPMPRWTCDVTLDLFLSMKQRIYLAVSPVKSVLLVVGPLTESTNSWLISRVRSIHFKRVSSAKWQHLHSLTWSDSQIRMLCRATSLPCHSLSQWRGTELSSHAVGGLTLFYVGYEVSITLTPAWLRLIVLIALIKLLEA